MRYKQIMILAIFLVSLLAVSAVSAEDNATGDVANADDSKLSIENTQEASLNEEISVNETGDNVLAYEIENEDFQTSQKEDDNHYGYWVNSIDMYDLNLSEMQGNGVSDIFLNYRIFSRYSQNDVETWISQANDHEIKIHIWTHIFYEGGWIRPIKNGTANQEFFDNKTAELVKYANVKGVAGVHYDYLRFSGSAYYNNAAEQNPGGMEAITLFVNQSTTAIRNANPNIIISAALMPEIDYLVPWYGDNYTEISRYMDVIIPMVYTGNFRQNANWVRETTKWFCENSRGAKVWTGLQGYTVNDIEEEYISESPVSQISNEINAALDGGADGAVIFRWGVTHDDYDFANLPIIEAEYSTFNNLDYLISCSESLAILDRDFIFNETYDAGYVDGIGIHRDDLIIDGNGHIIDANNRARMFNVSGENITFKNINFINGHSRNGGIIYCNANNLTIINCTFANGNAVVEGGALFAKSGNAKIIASKFFNNTAVYNAAVYMNGINSTVTGSYFEHNVANVSAGAIGWAKKDNGIIMDSIFVDNSALDEGGGAIFWNQGLNGKILNCTFESNYAIFNGSAIFLNSDDTLVSDCVFANNNASDLGGAIFIKRQTGYIKNSRFISNSADVGGAIGAFYNVEIDNCTFADNMARHQKDDVAIYVRISDVAVKNVTYGDAVNIVVNVTRQNGNVSVTINDEIYSAAVFNGTATVNILDLDAGNYTATVTYLGDANCTNPKRDVGIVVIPQTPAITAKSAGFVINYGGKYSIVLRDKKGNGLAGQKIRFTLAGRYVGSANTDKRGVATIKLTSKNLKTAKTGTKSLVMKLVSKNYKAIDKSVNIKISKEKTKITAKKATFKMANKVKKYSVLLKNSKNKAIKKAKVTLKVKGNIYKAKTNSKGKATFKITKLTKKGKFTAIVKYAGSKYYKARTVKAKITVK